MAYVAWCYAHSSLFVADYISFSAHVDYEQSRDFVKLLKPPHLVSGWGLRMQD